MSGSPLVVEAVRGDVVESTHLVDVAVVAPEGTLRAWAGEPHTVAYLRSAAKPIQATVCMELGWEPPGVPQLAVACASHNGEPQHVEAVRGTLTAAGLDESALRCPSATPSVIGAAPPPEAHGPIFHNCSGKHAAMLATTVARGSPPERYLDVDTELGRAIRARVGGLAGRGERGRAADGCGVETFAFTLAEAARIFARLHGEAPRAIEAMRALPALVAGSHRLCTSVMSRIPGVVLKVGAEGLMCGAVPEGRIGFALKARDGAARGREIASVHVLSMLGALGDLSPDPILNDILPRLSPGGGRHPSLRLRGSLERA